MSNTSSISREKDGLAELLDLMLPELLQMSALLEQKFDDAHQGSVSDSVLVYLEGSHRDE